MAAYYVWSGATGTGTGATWATAYTSIVAALTSGGKTVNDVFYLAHDHSESNASSTSLDFAGSGFAGSGATANKVICVNRSGSVPPVSADRRATAQVSTTANNNLFISGFVHFDGIIFVAGNSTGAPVISPQTLQAGYSRFDNCSLRIGSTGAGKIGLGSNGGVTGSYTEWRNTTVSFAAVTQTIETDGMLLWQDTPSALLGTIPTTLFNIRGGSGGSVECRGVDFSAAGSGKTIVGAGNSMAVKYRLLDCKTNASATLSTVPNSVGSTEVDFIRSGSSGVNYTVRSHRRSGLLVEETTIVRSGGASDGTTTIAWNIATTANCSSSLPFETPPIAIWNDITGSVRTATIEGIWGGGAVPNDNDIWVDVEYLGDAGSPQASFINDGTADLLTTAAAQTSSSATWGGSTTKFKLNVSFTAQQKGWIYARVKCGKPSTTFYIDPLVTLT